MEKEEILQKYRRMTGPGRRQELLERFEVNPRGKLRTRKPRSKKNTGKSWKK